MHDHIQAYFADGQRWGVQIRYLYEENPLGTGGALGLMPHDEKALPLLVMNGDLLTTLDFQNLLDFHQTHQSMISLCVREYEHKVPFGVIEAQDHQVISIKEKPSYQFFVNAGIYLLDPQVVKSVLPHVRIDMPDVIQHHLDKGHKVHMFPIHEYWLDIGRMDDFKKAQQDFETVIFQ